AQTIPVVPLLLDSLDREQFQSEDEAVHAFPLAIVDAIERFEILRQLKADVPFQPLNRFLGRARDEVAVIAFGQSLLEQTLNLIPILLHQTVLRLKRPSQKGVWNCDFRVPDPLLLGPLTSSAAEGSPPWAVPPDRGNRCPGRSTGGGSWPLVKPRIKERG